MSCVEVCERNLFNFSLLIKNPCPWRPNSNRTIFFYLKKLTKLIVNGYAMAGKDIFQRIYISKVSKVQIAKKANKHKKERGT